MEIRRLEELLRKIPKARPRLLYSLALERRLRNKFHAMSGASPFGIFVRQFRYAIASSMAVVIVITSSGYAYASPNVAHGDVLFPIKRAMESARLAVTISSEERATYIARLSERRAAEAVQLVNVRARALDSAEVEQSLDQVAMFSDSAVAALADVHSTDQVNRALVRVQDRLEKIREKMEMLPVATDRVMIVLEENTEDLSDVRPSIAAALQADQPTFRVVIPRKPDSAADPEERLSYQLDQFTETLSQKSLAVPDSSLEAVDDSISVLVLKIRAAMKRGDLKTARHLMRKLSKLIHEQKVIIKSPADLQFGAGSSASPPKNPFPDGFKLLPVSPVDPRGPKQILELDLPKRPDIVPPEAIFKGPSVVISPSPLPILGPPGSSTSPVRRQQSR